MTFGVTDTEGRPKSTLLELEQFARVLEAVDGGRLTRTPTRTAVLFPAHVELHLAVLDDNHQPDREVMADVVQHAWIAARAADLSPAIARESERVPDVDLLIVASNKALLGQTFPALLRQARVGAHVYVSWFAGVGASQRGAWWPALEPVFGVEHRLRYGLADIADDVVILTFQQALGDLDAGATLRFPASGDRYARAYLPVQATTAEVIATDQHGRPALVRRVVGDGAIYLGTYPLEFFGAERPDAHEDDQTWRLYRALASAAGIRPAVTVDTARVFADQMVHPDGTVYTWLVNTGAQAVTARLDHPRGTLWDALTAEDVSASCALPPFGLRVVRHGAAEGAGQVGSIAAG